MKKIYFITIILLLLCSCDKEEHKSNTITNNKEEEIKETYTDDNPITIGLYLYKNSWTPRKLITDYSTTWNENTDIVSFEVFTTNETEISGENNQTLWYKYWNNYSNIDDYNIGFNINYSLVSGEEVNLNILKPSDVFPIFDYIQLYLYDDVNQEIGAWYSHITEEEYNDNTIISSIKLTGSTKINEVNAPIKLTVFTYNSTDDFDSTTGNYHGNSKYTLTLYKD